MQNDVTERPNCRSAGLALASFKAWVHLVDDVNPAFTANQTVCAVTAFQGLKGVLDFHRTIPSIPGSARGEPIKNSVPQATRTKSEAGLMPIAQMSRRESHLARRILPNDGIYTVEKHHPVF